MRTALFVSLAGVLASGCAVDEPDVSAHVANISSGSDGRVGAAVRVEGADGAPMSLSGANASITVETRQAGQDWEEALEVVADTNGRSLVDVVVVADNSGSQAQYLDEIYDAVEQFSHVILASSHDDRAGLVRVSTVASVLQELTPSEDDMGAAIGGMFVSNGWTALWDGVRLANEVLARGAVEQGGESSLCVDRAARSIVVFTDGQDNNSADENDTIYEGDGIDTTLDQLFELRVNDQATSIYTVGVGDEVDEMALEALADNAGGAYRAINSYMGLIGALRGAAAQLSSQVPVCFTPASCDDTEARITVTMRERGKDVAVTRDFFIEPNCQ